jgi:hypothetical protein
VLLPGPEQVLVVVVLLPVFPCPEVEDVVVVVELFVLLPTFVVVGGAVQVAVPFVLSKVPPEAAHCCAEDSARAGVGPNANNERDVAALSRAMRIVADIGFPPMMVFPKPAVAVRALPSL